MDTFYSMKSWMEKLKISVRMSHLVNENPGVHSDHIKRWVGRQRRGKKDEEKEEEGERRRKKTKTRFVIIGD